MQKTEDRNFYENYNETSVVVETIYEYILHWKWFVLSVLLCLLTAVALILIKQKEYKPMVSVLLNEEKGRGKNSADLDLETLGILSTTNNIENEISILKSPDLMFRVVDSLNLQSTYFVKSRFRRTEIYGESPFRVEHSIANPLSMDHINLSIQKNATSYTVSGYYLNNQKEEFHIDVTDEVFPIGINIPGDSLEIRIILTGQEVVDNEKYFVEIRNINSTTAHLCSSLHIAQTSKSSSILNLSLLVNNSGKGVAILKELIKQYNAMNVRTNNEIAYNTALFINERLVEIARELGDAENEVVDYKQKYKITDLDSEAILFIHQTGQNEQKLLEIETQLNIIGLVERFITDPSNKLSIIPNLGISDQTLEQIITEYNSKLLGNELLLRGTGDGSPARIRLTEEIDNMHRNILTSIKNVKAAYEISKKDILRLSSSTQSRVRNVPQQEKDLIEKVRQQKIKEDLFLFLMQKREKTNLAIASTANKARIVSSMQLNVSPIAPQSKTILIVAFVIGLLVPIIVIYLANLLKIQVKNKTELEKLSNVAIIGEICKNRMQEHIVISPNENSIISELFRSLRNNVNFVLKQQQNKIILITSTMSGEGKTFISINLSLSFALAGYKILLVDADIRKSKVKRYMGITYSGKGLTDYISEEGTDWRKYICRNPDFKNFDILVSGTIPPNPNELLMNSKMHAFLKEARNEYDFVIVDTAPVAIVSDTYLLNDTTDITLYVVKENTTPKALITSFVNRQKTEEKLRNMYLVLNNTVLDNDYKYGYGKDYRYRYGYKYE